MFKFSNKADKKTGKRFYHYANKLYPFAQKRLGFDKPVTCTLVSDPKNAQKDLGYTAHYSPNNAEIVVYSDNRHVKDMLRSFAHELVHHAQYCRGDLDNSQTTEEGYAQKNKYMREMEREAYEQGNLIFRDWEDRIKKQKKEEFGDKDYTTSTKPEQHNVTYYTARKIDPNADAHHRLDVMGHNQAYDHSTLPWINKFEESIAHNLKEIRRTVSQNFTQKILAELSKKNEQELKEHWIGTARDSDEEISYFCVPKNKLFYLLEFSSIYGVDVKEVNNTWYQTISSGLNKLRNKNVICEIQTFETIRS